MLGAIMSTFVPGPIGVRAIVCWGSGICMAGIFALFLTVYLRSAYAAKMRHTNGAIPDETRSDRVLRLRGLAMSIGLIIAGAIIILAGLFKFR